VKIATKTTKDLTILGMPKATGDERIDRGMAWWQFMEYCTQARHGNLEWVGGVAPRLMVMDPITDIEITVCRTVEDVDAVVLNHDCDNCRAGVGDARTQVALGNVLAVIQFTYEDIIKVEE
jgi:hypothetical protein